MPEKMKKNYKINNLNRTKIVATIGPASGSVEVLETMIANGCSVFRINFSHGSHESHGESIDNIRQAAKNLEQNVAILGPCKSPRIATFWPKLDAAWRIFAIDWP